MQKDLSLKVNEDDACSVESTFRHLEELLQTLQGLGGSQDVVEKCGEIIGQAVNCNGDHMLFHLFIYRNID